MAKRGRKWVIKTADNGEVYFMLYASNGQVLLTSETYVTEENLWKTLNTLIGIKTPIKVESLV